MSHSIKVCTPDGRTHERVASDAMLSDWLESEHLPLNTRCGGRGLCRGCMVDIEGQEQRACQTSCSNVSEIRILESSQRDHRINGVSSFEIGSHNYTLRPRESIGLAIDIGTTTVAAAIWNLQSGECLATGSVANEQRRFGDNVLSRIDHAVSVGGASPELQSALVKDSLEPMIESLCEQAGIEMSAISEAIAAGNTVMQHSIAGAKLVGFAAFPFEPEFVGAQKLNAAEVGFAENFTLELAANLGPFVGADIAVGALASGMLEAEGPSLLIDFGTNGEILLKTNEGYLATATAAGPAFEGGRLNCGSAAGNGVISSLERTDGNWEIHFAGKEKVTRSTGITGAAYVDFMTLARRDGLLNAMGRFDPDHPEVYEVEVDGEVERRVKIHQKLFVSETDVAELIQAKAAIAAGVVSLLEEAEVEAEELTAVYIAGGFGYHLDCVHAMTIGMMPAVDPERIQVIGNASLGGASLLLQSDSAPAIEKLRSECRVIELNQIDSFEDNFIDCMPLDEI